METTRRAGEQRTDTLRDMWDSRPLRPRADRKLAGVASAIARRYEIDPTLVRIGFVVATIIGPGLPLYLAGCVVLPDAGRSDPAAPPPRTWSTPVLAIVLLVLAAFVVVPAAFSAERLIATVVTLGLLVALHLNRGARPGGRAATVAAAPAMPGVSPDAPTMSVPARTDPEAAPPRWDPLGVAPFAWDLPEPEPAPAPPPAPRSRLTPITLAVALVVAGMTGVLALAAPGLLHPSAVPASALAVVGIGLLVGAFRRAGRWLIGFATLLVLVTAVTTVANDAVGPGGWAVNGGVGPIDDAPTSVTQIAPEYVLGTGTIDLDLTGVDLTARPGADGPVRTRVEVGAGSLTVLVPENADIVVDGSTGFGDVTIDGRSRGGQNANLKVTDPGPDGPGGRPLELDLRSQMGSVEVQRG